MKRTNQEFSDLLSELVTVINNLKTFLKTEDDGVSLNDQSFTTFLDMMEARLFTYQVSLQRDYLKCVFVGRTSNGKSSVINALLRHSIIPMGVGHTTNCFITLAPKNIEEAYIEHFRQSDLVTPVSVFPMEKLKSLCHALSPIKVDSNDNIKVNYPVKLSPFGLNVQLVDSPGMDIDIMHDDFIDLHCRDADIFVLVTNAESVLMQCERHFFLRVKDKFSSPNIFIVNNRWDSSSEESIEEVNKVKKQQLNMFSDFLVRELDICPESQIQNRVFFISALEEIKIHANAEDNVDNLFGRIERSEDFKRLECILRENLSEKALKSKIALHLKSFQNTFEEINSFINCLFNSIIVQKEYIKKSIYMRSMLLKNLEADLARIHQKAANYIERLVTKASDNIAHDFNCLICNLDITVNNIKLDFDPYNLKEYLTFQRLIIEQLEASMFRDLKTKSMNNVNGKLKSGVVKLTEIYTELVLSSPSNPVINTCLTIACQPPIPNIYPIFSVVMNDKINFLKSQIEPIPSIFLSSEECKKYLNNVDNRFYALSNLQIEDNALTSVSNSRFPEINLMLPKFSVVILGNYTHTPGFQFSLSPNSLRLLISQWNSSQCPLRKKMVSISWGCILLMTSCGVMTYTTISYRGRVWKQGLAFIIGIYCAIFVAEKYTWDRKREVISLKNQFTIHCKQRLESIIHISSVTTARQLGSFLHLDLRGIQTGAETMVQDFRNQVNNVRVLENKVFIMEKKLKKIKNGVFLINQQLSAFEKNILYTDFQTIQKEDSKWTS